LRSKVCFPPESGSRQAGARTSAHIRKADLIAAGLAGVRKGTVFRIPLTPTARAQEPWGKKPVFRGVFGIPEQHENILGVKTAE